MQRTDGLDLAIPAEILELGQALPSTSGVRSRRVGEQSAPEQVSAMEERVLALVMASPVARKAVGIRDRRQDEAERRLRLRGFACVACRMLREPTKGMLDMTEAAVTAMDPKLAPGEALLVARHGIGRMIAEGVLNGCLDGQYAWNPRMFLPAMSLQWMSGGRSSLGIMTQQKMAVARLKGDADPDVSVPPPLQAKVIRERIAERIAGLEGGQLDVVASRLSMHSLRAKLLAAGEDPGTPNEVVLVLGESGTGKTWLCEQAGRATGLPYASCNAAEMTASRPAGYLR